jgi:hypothetical protein
VRLEHAPVYRAVDVRGSVSAYCVTLLRLSAAVPGAPARLDRNVFFSCPTVGAILGEQSFHANEGGQVVHSAFPDCDAMTGWIAGRRQVAFEFHVAYGPLQASPSHFGQLSEPGSNR